MTANTNVDKQITSVMFKERDRAEETRQTFAYDSAKNLNNSLDNSYCAAWKNVKQVDKRVNLADLTHNSDLRLLSK